MGVLAGPLLTWARIRDQSEVAIVDRCYRLRHNESQLMLDRVVTPLGLAGLVYRGTSGFAWATSSGLAAVILYKQWFGSAEPTTTTSNVEQPTGFPSDMKQSPWLDRFDAVNGGVY